MNFDDRPGPINAICVVWTLYIGYGLYNLSQANISGMPTWFSAYYLGLSVTQLVAIVGYWQMRKWGVLLFTSTVVIDQAMLVTLVGFQPLSLMLPLIVLFVGMAHYERMR